MGNTPSRFRRRRRTTTLTLPLDPHDTPALNTAGRALKAAQQALAGAHAVATPEATAALEAAEEAWETACREHPCLRLTFKALHGYEIQELQSDHPPTAAHAAMAAKTGDELEWDPVTYPPALLAASCAGVEWTDTGDQAEGLTVEEATELYESSSYGDQTLLIGTVRALCEVPSRVVELGKD